MKKIDKEELMEILEVKENTLNGIIKRKTLEQRLNKLDITLISVEKEGRNKYYNIDTLSVENQFKRLILKYKLLGREDMLDKYMEEMKRDIETEHTRGVLNKANKIGETEYHCKKYNDLLIKEDYMKKDGSVYIRCYRDKENEVVTREEWAYYHKQRNMFYKSKSLLEYKTLEERIELENYWCLEDFKRLGYVVLKLPKYVKSIMYDTLNDDVKKYFTVID